MPFLVDHVAREIALTRWALPECLHVPIAAVDEVAITTYIGEIDRVLSPRKALLIKVKEAPTIDPTLPIWELASSTILHQRQQVWVHIGYTQYRPAYKKAFPEEPIDEKVLSHLMNRHIAALKGFAFVRIVPTARGCNSSSGFSEQWGVTLHSTPEQIAANRRRGAFIQYADLPDLLVMLNMKLGGGFMEAANEGQALVRSKAPVTHSTGI